MTFNMERYCFCIAGEIHTTIIRFYNRREINMHHEMKMNGDKRIKSYLQNTRSIRDIKYNSILNYKNKQNVK